MPAAILILTLLPFAVLSVRDQIYAEEWSEVTGQVLATRITITESREVGRHGEIDYIAEAHVKYIKDGVTQDAWLPASEQFANRTQLAYWLSQKKSSLCIVRWRPKNPSRISAVLG